MKLEPEILQLWSNRTLSLRLPQKQEHGCKPKHNVKLAEEILSGTDAEGEVFMASPDSFMSDKWLIDSGATSHMTRSKELLFNYHKFEKRERVSLRDGQTVEAIGTGDVCLSMIFKVSKQKSCVMRNGLYIPKLACNLFSVRAAGSKSNVVMFGEKKCWIKERKGRLVGMGSLINKLYQLDSEPAIEECASLPSQKRNIYDLWHQRFGHLREQQMKAK